MATAARAPKGWILAYSFISKFSWSLITAVIDFIRECKQSLLSTQEVISFLLLFYSSWYPLHICVHVCVHVCTHVHDWPQTIGVLAICPKYYSGSLHIMLLTRATINTHKLAVLISPAAAMWILYILHSNLRKKKKFAHHV